ncbi:MAG: hypothetical protein LBR90_03845, partial [Elusimicrobiota bacterium]|nr:hypothetical protein [Elusimicrobiota bacterium]
MTKNITHLIYILTAVVIALCFGAPAHAQTAMVTNNFVAYGSSAWMDRNCGFVPGKTAMDILVGADKSYLAYSTATAVGSTDPWVNSALIEFDQAYPYSATSTTVGSYPNHCLSLCAEVTCANPVRKVN